MLLRMVRFRRLLSRQTGVLLGHARRGDQAFMIVVAVLIGLLAGGGASGVPEPEKLRGSADVPAVIDRMVHSGHSQFFVVDGRDALLVLCSKRAIGRFQDALPGLDEVDPE